MRACGVVGAALFGSAARGEAGPESDIDIVIDLAPGRKFSLIDLGGLRVRLCDWFGREADVLLREDLEQRFRARIERDQRSSFSDGRRAHPRARGTCWTPLPQFSG